MNQINFHDNAVNSRLSKKRDLKKYLLILFKKEGTAFQSIDIIFCSDDFLLDLNQKFLSHNYYTDTITFTLLSNPLVGEIYISIDRVKQNSQMLHITYSTELLRVILHGCLHLCGYNDKTDKDKKQMIAKQESYLKSWLVSRETQIGG